MSLSVGYLGFGEIGFALAKGMQAAGAAPLVAFDKQAKDLKPPFMRQQLEKSHSFGGLLGRATKAFQDFSHHSLARPPYSNAHPFFTPIALNAIAAGQTPVKDDCNRFNPMNTVNQTNRGDT